jgi:ABC-type multidrug transport system ATPase subunit
VGVDVDVAGISVTASGLSKTVARGVPVLQDVSLTVGGGELVAIVGGSGAGKTTLLEALSGISPADHGTVRFGDLDPYSERVRVQTLLGYVPQDDIIHAELPLARTLTHAARLRLPRGTTTVEVAERVDDAMRILGLQERAGTLVAALSGGQRKRASIAVEMLTAPRIFFLDEPTSGLDPATAAGLTRTLRALADRGATVIFTTHSVQDLAECDRIAFLARGGRLVFVGDLAAAYERFGATEPHEIYARLDDADSLLTPVAPAEATRGADPPAAARPVGPFRQWAILTARTFETLRRNRLTLAILLGAPAMVVAMFAVLFKAGAFEPPNPDPTSMLMIVFWIAFGSFFFGLTYGLLQVVTEWPILRREHFVGLRLGPYLLSKIAVLLPFLIIVNVVMLFVLRAFDRLPADDLSTYLSVAVTLSLGVGAALTLGLLASALVNQPSQATLALPLLCFPAVLFSGAILPVHVMAPIGRWMSVGIPVRWAFEALGHDLGVRNILSRGASPLGPPLVASYGNAGLESTGTYWAYLVGFAVLFWVLAWAVLRVKSVRSSR